MNKNIHMTLGSLFLATLIITVSAAASVNSDNAKSNVESDVNLSTCDIQKTNSSPVVNPNHCDGHVPPVFHRESDIVNNSFDRIFNFSEPLEESLPLLQDNSFQLPGSSGLTTMDA